MSVGGTVALVNQAHASRLGDLVRTLRHSWPELDVLTNVRDLDTLERDRVFVLVPKAQDADYLNFHHQIIVDRRLKIVLWCDEETTVAQAPLHPIPPA